MRNYNVFDWAEFSVRPARLPMWAESRTASMLRRLSERFERGGVRVQPVLHVVRRQPAEHAAHHAAEREGVRYARPTAAGTAAVAVATAARREGLPCLFHLW